MPELEFQTIPSYEYVKTLPTDFLLEYPRATHIKPFQITDFPILIVDIPELEYQFIPSLEYVKTLVEFTVILLPTATHLLGIVFPKNL